MPRAVADRKTVDSLLKSLMLVSRSVEEVLDTRAVIAACGDPLSPSKVRMLRLITHSGKQSIGQIARFLGVSDPAASQLADALVRQKLILRNVDPNDRRTAYLRLTASGKKLSLSIEREQRHRVRLALQSAGSSKASAWNNLLRNVCQHLTAAEKTFGEYCLQCGAHEDSVCILEGGNHDCLYIRKTARKTPRPAKSSRLRKSSPKKGARRARA